MNEDVKPGMFETWPMLFGAAMVAVGVLVPIVWVVVVMVGR